MELWPPTAIPTAATPRKTRAPGAQPGNLNALQHGLYSERVEAVLSTDPEPDATPDLSREIKLLRKTINRIASIIETADEGRIESLLNTLGAASIRVASLHKSQKLLGGKSSPLENLLQQAISDVIQENSLGTSPNM